MSMKRDRKAGFTLVETIFALAIGGLVLTCVSTILVQGMRIWSDFTGQWLICQQSRIAREKLLRGSFGVGGLRDATDRNINWYHNDDTSMFTFSKASDSNHYYAVWTTSNANMVCSRVNNGQPLSDLSDYQVNSREGVECKLLSCVVTNQQLTCQYKMSVTTRGRTYSKISKISTAILNK